MVKRLVGFLGSCPTPECGGAAGYFCVLCRHYVEDCLCSPGGCACPDDNGWASIGERKMIREKLGIQ